MNVQKFQLNLIPGGVPVYIQAAQFEAGRPYEATMWDGKELYVFDGTESVTIRGTKANGEGFSVDMTDADAAISAPAGGSVLTFKNTKAMTDATGPADVSFILSIGEIEIGTINVCMQVQRDGLQPETVIHSDSFGSIITEAVEEYIAEHGTGGGLTDDMKAAIMSCFNAVVWKTDSQPYLDALEDALYNSTWPVENELTHCSSSNAAASVTKGGSYSATITPSAGYTLTGATVSITMGGEDITATAYDSGVIDIGTVTGALVISISAAPAGVESIEATFTQGSAVIWSDDSLDTLKQYLVVVATLEDESEITVSSDDYTLSGTLTAGTSTITVTYQSKTDTFDVTVTAAPVYRLPQGTHTFSDGSYVTVSDGNHVKCYCASASGSLTNYGAVFNFSDIDDNGTAISSSANRDNKSLKFTLPSGSECNWYIKNMSSNTANGPSIGNRVANGTSTVQSGFGFTSSGTTWQKDGSNHVTGDYTSTVTASGDLKIGSLWLYIEKANAFAGCWYEFDVEIWAGTTRYV